MIRPGNAGKHMNDRTLVSLSEPMFHQRQLRVSNDGGIRIVQAKRADELPAVSSFAMEIALVCIGAVDAWLAQCVLQLPLEPSERVELAQDARGIPSIR